MKQIHFFYFYQRTESAPVLMVAQVAVEHDATDDAAKAQLATHALSIVSEENNLPPSEIRALCVVDIPELKIMVRRGDVQAVFGKVSVTHPEVTVYDLDSCPDEQEAETRVLKLLETQGFRSIPFHQGDTATTPITPQ